MNPGDARFEDLYNRYFRRVFIFMVRFGFPQEKARDLAQDTFVRVYQNMGGYRGEAEWGYIEAAAKSVAYNEVRSRETRKRKGDEIPIEPKSDIADTHASQEDALMDREEIERLRDVIEELPRSLKVPLLLHLEDLTYTEVARILNITVDAVKSRLRDARIKLRERLGAEIETFGEGP